MNQQEAEERLKACPVKNVAFMGDGELPCRVAFPCVHNPGIRVVVGMADTWDEAVEQAERSAASLTKKEDPEPEKPKKRDKKKNEQPSLFPE